MLPFQDLQWALTAIWREKSLTWPSWWKWWMTCQRTRWVSRLGKYLCACEGWKDNFESASIQSGTWSRQRFSPDPSNSLFEVIRLLSSSLPKRGMCGALWEWPETDSVSILVLVQGRIFTFRILSIMSPKSYAMLTYDSIDIAPGVPTISKRRSASSMTRYLRDRNENPLVFSRWSSKRPGVATMMCGFLESAIAWGTILWNNKVSKCAYLECV